MIPHDYHLHSHFSCDCQATMAEQCAGAIARGLPEIGFTDHYDLHPLDECAGYFRLAEWAAEIDRVRADFAARLIVRAGIELGEPHLYRAEAQAILQQYPFDYALGSLHWIGDELVFDPKYFERPADAAFGLFFEELERMTRAGGFDVLSHFDVVVRAGLPIYGEYDPRRYADVIRAALKNCVDHGMETPEERVAAGKPVEGVISFNAFQKGGMILVQIKDDGRGMDLEKIARKAGELNLLKPGEMVTEANFLDIICKPGFSTASEVTALSGRGVGMDVVRTEVEKLGGTLSAQTEKGKGTTFTLSLPLTFALMDALHVKAHGRSYLIPLWGVVGTEGYRPESVRFFGAEERVYRFRDEYVPVVSVTMPGRQLPAPSAPAYWSLAPATNSAPGASPHSAACAGRTGAMGVPAGWMRES